MDKMLEKLSAWIKVIQAALIGTVVVEAILIIIIGIASNRILDTFNYWAAILIGSCIIYLFLLIIRTLYQVKFPSSIVEELMAKKQLEEKILLFDRQKAINEYITTAIQELNKQTCSIDNKTERENLCDEQLESRLSELLIPIVKYTDVLLDTSTEKKFTIGLHLNSYNKFPSDYSQITIENNNESQYIANFDLISDRGLLLLNRDLGLGEILTKDLLDDSEITGAAYEIQTAIRRTLNNCEFGSCNFLHNGIEYTIITSEILEVCSDNSVDGVLFIIHKAGINHPSDISDILRIFNRLAANYISKYNFCIYSEVLHKASILSASTI